MGNCCTQTLMRLCYRLLRDYFYTKCSTWTSRKCRERYANVYTRTSVLVGLHNYLRLGATLRTHRECNIAYTNTSRAHTGDLSRGFREPIAKFFVQRTVCRKKPMKCLSFSNIKISLGKSTLNPSVLCFYIVSLFSYSHTCNTNRNRLTKTYSCKRTNVLLA